MSLMDTIGKCSRCEKFLIAEECENHICTPNLRGVKEIVLDYYYKGFPENNDEIIMAMGLDGWLYRLVVCKHNPPHRISNEFLQGKKSNKDFTEPP